MTKQQLRRYVRKELQVKTNEPTQHECDHFVFMLLYAIFVAVPVFQLASWLHLHKLISDCIQTNACTD